MLTLRLMLPRSRTFQTILVGFLLLGLAWQVWRSEEQPTELTSSTVVTSKAASPQLAPVFPMLPAQDQRQQQRQAAFASAPVMEERVLPPDAAGRYVKQRVIQWQGKYPLLRIEEDYDRQAGEPGERRVMVADHLMVKRRAGVTETQFQTWVHDMGLSIRRHLPGSDVYLIALPSGSLAGFDAMMAKMNGEHLPVEYAEADPLRFAASTPNDALFPIQWALHNAGQTGGVPDVDVDAPEAWATTRGNSSLVVAVLDSGLELNHPDLQPNLWVNAAEIASNHIDDDADGFVDNVNGWNFYNETNTLTDSNGHGTHCAGIIGATGNNSIGVSGIVPLVKLMPLVVMNSNGEVVTSDAVAAMNHAVAKRALVTSNSYGGTLSTKTEKAAIDAALAQGILVVCAAGNDYPAKNIDSARLYPAAYSSANIISVAATTDVDTRAVFSNYGSVNVDLGAPGVGILSTVTGAQYGYESGTSMACPLVAGACVLVKAAHPMLTWSEIKSAILNSVDPVPALKGLVKTGGRLNAARAVKIGAQPWIEVIQTAVKDAKLLGANGNGDGIVNAGEDVTVAITIKNMGPVAATGASTRLTLLQNASDVTLLRDTRTLGTVAVGASLTNNTSTALPFLLRISPGATEQQVTLVFTHTDSASRSWTSQSTLSIAGTHTLSGKVTLLTGGKPMKGAIVSYTGPITGSVTTLANGTYSARLPDGTYTLTARATGYEPSVPQQITVPSTAAEINFSLGRSVLVVAPTSVAVTQPEQGITSKTLTFTNKGDLPLNLNVQNSSLGNAISTSYYNLPSYGAAHSAQAANAPLPWQDGFESGTSSLVPSRYHEEYEDEFYYYVIDYYFATSSVVTDTAAVGRRSLHYRDPWFAGFDNGMQRRFADGTQPRYISYWVRPGSSTGTSGCFGLEYGTYSSYSKKWSWDILVSIRADAGGRLAVNDLLPGSAGDNSVPFTSKTWHHIELRNINWTARRFDYWVNGTLIKAGIPLLGAATEATRVHLYNETIEGESWWDELRVLDQDDLWLSHTPSTLALAPGASGTMEVTTSAMNQRPGVYKAQLNVFSNDPVRPQVNVPVTMTVTPHANIAPVVAGQTVTTIEDTPVVITFTPSDADGDSLTITVLTKPALGKLLVNGSELLNVPTTLPGLSLTYVPSPDGVGAPLTSFTCAATDYRLSSKPATVTIHVTPVDDAVLAVDDYFPVSTAGGTKCNVLANDREVDGDTLTLTLLSQPARGAAVLNTDHTVTYTPLATFAHGTDTFTYRVDDGQGSTSTAVVTLGRGQLVSPDWTTFAGSMERNSSSPARLNNRPLVQQWSTDVGGVNLNQAAIVGRLAVVTSNSVNSESIVTALDLATGTQVWRQNLPVASSTSAPTVDGGRVFVMQNATRGVLTCLDLMTGTLLWQAETPGALYNLRAPAAFAGQVVIQSTSSSVAGAMQYDALTGAEVRRYTTSSGADLCISQGRLLLPRADGTLESYDISSGALGQALPGFRDSGGYGVSVAHGWRISPSYEEVRLNDGQSAVISTISGAFGSPAASDGVELCIAAFEGGLLRLYNMRSRKLLRSFDTGRIDSLRAPLLLADAVLASTPYTTTTYVFQRSTGQRLQTLPVGGELSVAHGFLVVARGDGVVSGWTAPSATAHAPVASILTLDGTEDTPLPISLTGTDVDPGTTLSAVITALPTKGMLYQTTDGVTPGAAIQQAPTAVTDPAMRVILEPSPDGYGAAQTAFEFKVTDGQLYSKVAASVTVNLASVPDAPKPTNDRFYVTPGSITTLQPLTNDVEPDESAMVIASLGTPTFGTATLNGGNAVRFTCSSADSGRAATLSYTVRDSTGRTAQALITVIVGSARSDEWPSAHNTGSNLRTYQGTLGSTGHQQLWSLPLSNIPSHPIIAEGTVFMKVQPEDDYRSQVRAIDLITGAEKWRVTVPGLPASSSQNYASSYLTYDSGALYFIGSDAAGTLTAMTCLSAVDGALRWLTTDSALDLREPSRVVGSLVIASTRSSGIAAFSTTEGRKLWSTGLAASNNVIKTAVYQDRLFTLISGMFREHLLSTGAVLSERNLARTGDNVPSYINPISDGDIVIDQGVAYLTRSGVSSSGGRFYAVDINAAPSVGFTWVDPGFYSMELPVRTGSEVHLPITSQIKSYSPTLQTSSVGYPLSYAELILVANDVMLASKSSDLNMFQSWDRQLAGKLASSASPRFCAASNRIVVYVGSGSMGRLICYAAPPSSNQAPVAQAQSLNVAEDSQVTVTLGATDADQETPRLTVQTLPAKGMLYQTTDGITRGSPVLNVPALVTNLGGNLIFAAAADAIGTGAGSFTFGAFDASSASSTATVTIDITGSNDAPVAVPDQVTLRPGEVLASFKPQANDRDFDGDALQITATTAAAHGTVVIAADGLSLTYTPSVGSDRDSFSYTISDPSGESSSSTVTVEIAPFGAAWTTSNANPARNSFVATRLGSEPLQLLWSRNLPAWQEHVTSQNFDMMCDAPVVANGRAMLGHYPGGSPATGRDYVIGLDAITGADLWRAQTLGSMNGVKLSWHAGRLHLLHPDQRLEALSDADGSPVWSTQLPSQAFYNPIAAPALTSTHAWVVAEQPVLLRGLDLASGNLGLGKTIQTLPAYSQIAAHQSSLLVAPSTDVVAVDADTGALRWITRVPEASASGSPVCCSSSTAFVIKKFPHPSQNIWLLTALDLATGQLRWSQKLKAAYSSLPPVPAAAHQAVFVESGTEIVMLDEATGKQIKAFDVGEPSSLVQQAPIITVDSVVSVTDYKVRVFDLHTRALKNTLSVSWGVQGVSAADGRLYITGSTNEVFCHGFINSTNASPTAQPLTFTGTEEQPVTITLEGSDPTDDSLVFDIVSPPATGRLYQTTDGVTLGLELAFFPARVVDVMHRVIYVPQQSLSGVALAAFTYAVHDGNSASSPATVTININADNDPPLALTDAFTVQAGQVISPLPVLGNDFDMDGDTLSIAAFTQPGAGAVILNTDGTLRYEAPASISGLLGTSFNYTVQDTVSAQASARVNIRFDSKAGGSWPTAGYDERRSGYAPGTVGTVDWTEIWRQSLSEAFYYSMHLAAEQDRLYNTTLTSTGAFVQARSLATGAIIWTSPRLSSETPSYPLAGPDRLLLQCGTSSNARMHSLSVVNGYQVWHTGLSMSINSSIMQSPLVYGASLIAPASDGWKRLDWVTGLTMSSNVLASGASYQSYWTPSLSGDLLVSHFQDALNVDDLANGSRWSLALPPPTSNKEQSVAAADRLVFAITGLRKLECIDLSSRQRIWKVGNYHGRPAVRGQEVYAVSHDSPYIHARSIVDGSLIRSYQVGGVLSPVQPVVTDNLLIMRNWTQTVIFDRLTAQMIATLPGSASYEDPCQIILAGETLVTRDSSSNLIAYAPSKAITFSPASGTFSSAQNITLTAADTSATIHYTTDGSAPNLSSPTVASGGSVFMDHTGKVRAITVKGSAVSRIVEASYTIGASGAASALAFNSSSTAQSINDSQATADFDRDGQSDLAEAVAGTNPMNAADVFEITSSSVSTTDGANLSISWPSKAGRSYRVQRSTDLQSWIDISASLPGTGATLDYRLSAPASGPSFLRVRIE